MIEKCQHSFPHAQCKYYIDEYYIGFRMVSPRKGDMYEGKKFEFHTLVFILEGEVMFSYNEYLNRHFRRGDIFFVPQASDMYGEALEDALILVLTFNTHLDYLCEACSLTNYIGIRDVEDYDFTPLPMTDTVWNYVRLVGEYIEKDMRCAFLHRIKQSELFVLLQYCYSEEDLLRLFYPALGISDFRSWVLENYKRGMSVAELANRYNMEAKTFSRRFTKEFGITPRTWVLRQKAKHILLKLSMPGTTVNDIITEFDFANQSYFYTFCKEQYGCTVTDLLRKIRDEKCTKIGHCEIIKQK